MDDRAAFMPAALIGLVLAAGCGSGEPPAGAAPAAPRTAAGPDAPPACRPGTAVDLRDRSEVEIRFGEQGSYRYEPDCLRVRRGARLRFFGDLAAHPLEAGTVDGLEVHVAPGNPIPSADAGREAVAVMAEPGSFGFFCGTHVHEAMKGRIFVE